MEKIAVLGLGAMGSRMAVALLNAGHKITVWNRTPTAAAALAPMGAEQAPTPREAVSNADFVLSMVRDDKASREVWLAPETGALAGMKKGAIAIESSTLKPGWIRDLGNAGARLGIPFLEAPVVGSRPQAEAAQLVFLAAGDEDILKRSEPVFRNMGKTIHHVGSIGSGALVKLATNALLGVQVTALAELIALLESNGADVGKAIAAMSSTAAWSPAATYLTNSMIAGNFAAQFPVNLIEKDFGYAVGLASSPTRAPTISAARAVFQRAIEQNLGEENMTSVIRLFAK